MLDPTNHAPDGVLDVQLVFAARLSTEQLFREVQSLSVHDRDPIARRTMMFDALDTLAGLTRITFDTRCKLGHAQDVLGDLRDVLHADAAAVLLPRAERAVAALHDLQKGFFLPSRVTSTAIRLPNNDGTDVLVPLESAAASWLRVLRNAGHGFGGRPAKKARNDGFWDRDATQAHHAQARRAFCTAQLRSYVVHRSVAVSWAGSADKHGVPPRGRTARDR